MTSDAVRYVLRLPFTRPPVTANEARNGTAHWRKQGSEKRTVEEAVVAVVQAAGIPHLDRCEIRLIWHAPDFIRRDCDGLYPMLKAVQDALTPPRAAIPKGARTKGGTPRKTAQRAKVGAGIIDDDHAGIVIEASCRIEQGSADPRVELHLTALPPLPPLPVVVVPAPRSRPRRPAKTPEVRAPRETSVAQAVAAAQPVDGGAAWRARVEAARRRA